MGRGEQEESAGSDSTGKPCCSQYFNRLQRKERNFQLWNAEFKESDERGFSSGLAVYHFTDRDAHGMGLSL